MTLRVLAVCVVATACDGVTSERAQTILALTGDVVNGESLYSTNCASCHLADGSGDIGSNIQGVDQDLLVDAMLNGRTGMISYADLFVDQEIADIAAYAEGL